VLGYLLHRRGFEPAPLLLGFVLSQPLEENARRALLFAEGNPLTFLSHPVSATLLAIAAVLLVSSIRTSIRAARSHASAINSPD
jgi:putative tricarboxylic transport membrane protein